MERKMADKIEIERMETATWSLDHRDAITIAGFTLSCGEKI